MKSEKEPRKDRMYSITFDTVAERKRYHDHAKRRGLTLAGLIKSMLSDDFAKHGPLPTGQG